MSSKVLRSASISFVLCLSTVACGDDIYAGASPHKGMVDVPTLQAGVTVTLAGDLGTVDVPFLIPVPESDGDTGGDDDLEAALASAVSVVVSSKVSGVTADVASGVLVDADPAGPGEWMWQLNDARDVATMTFFNGSANGLALEVAVTYDAAMAIATNPYIEAVDMFEFDVMVVEE